MTPSYPSDSARQYLLEEVLEEYMQRLDRGEGVDREQLLARHPELADELRSYFAGSDEIERLGPQGRGEAPALPPFRALPETCGLEGTPPARGVVRHVGDHYQLVAGERRLRAAQEAGLKSVPIRVVDFNDQRRGRLSLIRHLLDHLPARRVPESKIKFPPLEHAPQKEKFRGPLKPITAKDS